MPRIALALPAVASILLGAGCARQSSSPSAFAGKRGFPEEAERAAKQVGVTRWGYRAEVDHGSKRGRSYWEGKVSYCARPDQIDELMRALHKELIQTIRESGGGADAEAPPPAPAEVKGWRIVYSAGSQEGTIEVARNDGTDEGCKGPGELQYQIDFVFSEAPKAAP